MTVHLKKRRALTKPLGHVAKADQLYRNIQFSTSNAITTLRPRGNEIEVLLPHRRLLLYVKLPGIKPEAYTCRLIPG